MAEKFRFEQLPGKPRTIQIEERLAGPRPIAVNPVGQYTLAGTGFALQQNGAFAAHHSLCEFLQASNGSAGPKEGIDNFPLKLGNGGRRLAAVTLVGQDTLQCGMEE